MNDNNYMDMAVEEMKKCKPSNNYFCVGAVLVKNDMVIGKGYSRKFDKCHAEEAALEEAKVWDQPVEGATMYVTLEPCSKRNSSPTSCTKLLIKNKIKRVVMAAHEPDTFQKNDSTAQLKAAHITVEHAPQFEKSFKECNHKILSQ